MTAASEPHPPPTAPAPAGVAPVDGIVHRRSPLSVDGTVERLAAAIDLAGAKVFAVVDQGREASQAGLSLRDTRLVVFGNPSAGTAVMQAAPVAALDLPLKVLVWADDAGQVWMTTLAAAWLADRYGLASDVARPLAAADALADRVAAQG